MAWRKAPAGPAAGVAGELERYAAIYERAAASDAGAAERLAAVRSWLEMLAAAGGDEQIGDLFAEFARLDWDVWVRGVA